MNASAVMEMHRIMSNWASLSTMYSKLKAQKARLDQKEEKELLRVNRLFFMINFPIKWSSPYQRLNQTFSVANITVILCVCVCVRFVVSPLPPLFALSAIIYVKTYDPIVQILSVLFPQKFPTFFCLNLFF